MILFRSAAEARSQLHPAFPNLSNARWSIRSPFDTGYQCIAWAACRTDRVWWPWDHPNFYWPPEFGRHPVNSAVPVEDFVQVFEQKFGYRTCTSADFEFGYQKVAIYSDALGATHMARQRLLSPGWLSKLGIQEDIVHGELDDINCVTYGSASHYMKRSWWTALCKLCLFRGVWESIKFGLYRTVVRWDLK